jgi:hypothetical protein
MKRTLLWLCLLLFAATPAAARSESGVIIFGAWWDSNRDGVVVSDTDVHSLFQLESDPGAPPRITPITQQDAFASPIYHPRTCPRQRVYA